MAEKKFLDKIKYFMGYGVDDDDFDDDDEKDDSASQKSQPTASSLYPASTYTAGPVQTTSAGGKLVNINKGGNMKVVIYAPKSFDDTKQIVDNLKAKRPVIINIESLEKELARKIFDFCSGALYALDGHIQQISRGIFILAPNNVDVSSDIKNELESKGIFNWNSLKD